MPQLTDFAITRLRPPRDPEAIQLYAFPTPNGVKAAIALEELALPYDAHRIEIGAGEQFAPEFLAISPNNKIPAIIDPQGPGGAHAVFESGAILVHLAQKTGALWPEDAAGRSEVMQWLMWQMGGLGPMFGQVGWFLRNPQIEDPRPLERYTGESARLLRVLDGRLAGRDWVCGAYSIADIAIGPWLRNMRDGYKAAGRVGWDDLAHVEAYLERFLARPAVQRGLEQPAAR